MKKKKKLIITLSSIALILVILLSSFFIYTSSYYHADESCNAYLNSDDNITFSYDKHKNMIFMPESYDSKVIIYPGAKVSYYAYANLAYNLADNNILAIVIKMPYNLAFFDINAADKVVNTYQTDKTYIMGHSLGGAMAASYIYKKYDSYNGIIFLASYSTKNLNNKGLSALTIYGSNDKVLSSDKYNKYKGNLPSNYIEYEINGGNHAYYGTYGEQKGDGKATISNEEQINLTVNKIVEFIK